VGAGEVTTWDDRKREINLRKHGYDFADLDEAFDGRFVFTREDKRWDYGEPRFNMLVSFRGRIINVTFTPRDHKNHLISARPAKREERNVYHAQREGR
jgi:uncharacterized DUF497 family protein